MHILMMSDQVGSQGQIFTSGITALEALEGVLEEEHARGAVTLLDLRDQPVRCVVLEAPQGGVVTLSMVEATPAHFKAFGVATMLRLMHSPTAVVTASHPAEALGPLSMEVTSMLRCALDDARYVSAPAAELAAQVHQLWARVPGICLSSPRQE